MNQLNNGGPAFPYYHPDLGGAAGMSLRDYFAAKAQPGLLLHVQKMLANEGAQVNNVYELVALASYEMADAMLEARQS